MGRVTYTQLSVGDSGETVIDNIFAAIEAQTSTIDAENYAEEGIDERALETQIQAQQAFTPVTESSRGQTQALTSTWTAANPGNDLQGGAITVGTNERLLLMARVEFLHDSTQAGIPLGGDIKTRWRLTVGGTPTTYGTIRRIKVTTAVLDIGKQSGIPHRHSHMVLVDGPLTITKSDFEISDQSGNDVTVQYGSASCYGTIFKRVTV